MERGTIVVKLTSGNEEFDCNCGCGRRYPGLRGEAVRADGAERVLFFALMTECGDERHLWLALGSGPWDPVSDPRDCFCSVQMWTADGSVHAQVTDAARSPWKTEKIFTDQVARFLDREEVMQKSGVPEWLFAWTDELTTTGLPRLGRFLLRADN
jgi:hypothetical protein